MMHHSFEDLQLMLKVAAINSHALTSLSASLYQKEAGKCTLPYGEKVSASSLTISIITHLIFIH